MNRRVVCTVVYLVVTHYSLPITCYLLSLLMVKTLATDNSHPKERILKVALELFTKQGYEATSIDNIRHVAGFRSKASLYAHFKSKEEISDELKKRILEQIERVLSAAYEVAASDPLSQFVEVIRAYIKWGLTYRQEFAFRIIRAQEERMLAGKYDWQKDPEQNSASSKVYNLLLGSISQLKQKDYPVRSIPEAALVHMMVGAVSRAIIDEDSFGEKGLAQKVDLVVEVCMGIVFSQSIVLENNLS